MQPRRFLRFASLVIGLALAACTGGNGSYFSGHQVGIDRSSTLADIGPARVELAGMRSARNFPIPETRYFSFSWSPEGYAGQFRRNGWRLGIGAGASHSQEARDRSRSNRSQRSIVGPRSAATTEPIGSIVASAAIAAAT